MLMLKRTARHRNRDFVVRSMTGQSHAQHFATAASGDPHTDFSTLAALMEKEGIQPLQEKVYGTAGAKDEILGLRAAAYQARGLDPSVPVTYIDGSPISSARYAGTQIWGFGHAADGPGVSTVSLPNGTFGRCWKGDGCRMVYLPQVRGTNPGGALAHCPASQADRMFANTLNALRSQGMSYSQVIRTWIYIARILDWYGDFNRVRTQFHDTQGMVRGSHDSVFPASTGIQGRDAGGEECFMDVLAIDTSGDAEVHPILGSERQPPAFSYGAGFSRGMVLHVGGCKLVLVSGTASTDVAGEVVHLKKPEAQCMETLLSIASILKEQGGGLEDICMSTLFCKTPDVYDAYENVSGLLGVADFPTVPVLADVCRPEWLVEIEAVAIIGPDRKPRLSTL